MPASAASSAAASDTHLRTPTDLHTYTDPLLASAASCRRNITGNHCSADPQPPSAALPSRDIAGHNLLSRDRKPDPSHPLSSHHIAAPQPASSLRNRTSGNRHCRNRDPDPNSSLSNHRILHRQFINPSTPSASSSVLSPNRHHGVAAGHISSELRPRRLRELPNVPHSSFQNLHSTPDLPTITDTFTTITSSDNLNTAPNPSTTHRSTHPRPPTNSSTPSPITPPHRRRTMRDTKPPATTKRDGPQAIEGRREHQSDKYEIKEGRETLEAERGFCPIQLPGFVNLSL